MTDSAETDNAADGKPHSPARYRKRRAKHVLKTQPPERYLDTYLEQLDARFKAARVLQARLVALYASLGGADSLSYQQQSLCKRAIHLEWRLEENERRLALGETEAPTEAAHTQMLNSLIGLFRALGLERRAKRVPDLKAYLEETYADADDHQRD